MAKLTTSAALKITCANTHLLRLHGQALCLCPFHNGDACNLTEYKVQDEALLHTNVKLLKGRLQSKAESKAESLCLGARLATANPLYNHPSAQNNELSLNQWLVLSDNGPHLLTLMSSGSLNRMPASMLDMS